MHISSYVYWVMFLQLLECHYWFFAALTGIWNVEPRAYLNKCSLDTQEVTIKYQVSFRWGIISGEKDRQEISRSYSCKISFILVNIVHGKIYLSQSNFIKLISLFLPCENKLWNLNLARYMFHCLISRSLGGFLLVKISCEACTR